jgi:ubiquinone/menaquinone biosynthesis C-methylase UbiE
MGAVLPEQRTRLDYDLRAESFARHRDVHPGVVQALLGSGFIGAETRVLDVGCGTGNYAHALASLSGCRMSGVDPSAEMLARARDATGWDALLLGKAEALPFADDAFDLVMSTDVIHHVGDRGAYFREAARVLRPGGHIVTVTDSHDDLALRRPLTSHFPETLVVEHKRYPPVERLLAEMASAGLAEPRLDAVSLEYELTDIQAYRERAFSSLLLIDEAAFQRGLARLKADLQQGPVSALSLYTIIWGTLPQIGSMRN